MYTYLQRFLLGSCALKSLDQCCVPYRRFENFSEEERPRFARKFPKAPPQVLHNYVTAAWNVSPLLPWVAA